MRGIEQEAMKSGQAAQNVVSSVILARYAPDRMTPNLDPKQPPKPGRIDRAELQGVIGLVMMLLPVLADELEQGYEKNGIARKIRSMQQEIAVFHDVEYSDKS